MHPYVVVLKYLFLRSSIFISWIYFNIQLNLRSPGNEYIILPTCAEHVVLNMIYELKTRAVPMQTKYCTTPQHGISLNPAYIPWNVNTLLKQSLYTTLPIRVVILPSTGDIYICGLRAEQFDPATVRACRNTYIGIRWCI